MYLHHFDALFEQARRLRRDGRVSNAQKQPTGKEVNSTLSHLLELLDIFPSFGVLSRVLLGLLTSLIEREREGREGGRDGERERERERERESWRTL